MKYYVLFLLLNIFCVKAFCQDSKLYTVPDSVKATGFYAEVKITNSDKSNSRITGISADKAIVGMAYYKGKKVIKFESGFFHGMLKYMSYGIDVHHMDSLGCFWDYEWKENETYSLLIATASDSATNKTSYSGYIFLPGEKKWKLITTFSYDSAFGIKFISNRTGKNSSVIFSNRWLQRSNGSWKALDGQTTKPPSLRQMSNIDSLVQQKEDEALYGHGRIKDSTTYEDGVFYQTLKEGSGRSVNITDTVTVYYKGSLLVDGSVFDQTKQKPATFPLERLIKGWQIGLSHCRVGGKMRLYICSGSAYGIRTRSATIPPNSILVFEVEVLDAKEKIQK
jgi:FKBP-type peptidyl-prolyl cis-trans isomerase FkpA